VSEPLVTVGVPVYGGATTLPVLLECLRTQSYRNLDIVISVDAADRASADACAPFLRDDRRFRMEVQPTRLGWAGNTDWTMRNRLGEFYIYQQHDDLVSPTYVADLVAAATRWPDAALCFAMLRYTGTRSWDVPVPSVVGSPRTRVLSYLRRLDWVPFRGLVRGAALDRTAGLRLSDFDPFDSLGTEIAFLAELAREGEHRFVSGPLYFKAWDGRNLSARRDGWSREHRIRATACWAAWMVEAVVPVGATARERRDLFTRTLDRFIRQTGNAWWTGAILASEIVAGASPRMVWTQLKRRPPPPGLGPVSPDERADLARQVLDRLSGEGGADLRAALELGHDQVEALVRARYALPDATMSKPRH
jgi:hypothetical protein